MPCIKLRNEPDSFQFLLDTWGTIICAQEGRCAVYDCWAIAKEWVYNWQSYVDC